MPQAIAVFGLGLLGKSIYRSILNQTGSLTEEQLEFTWTPGNLQKKQAKHILQRMVSVCSRSVDTSKPVTILWAAGNSSFASEKQSTSVELANFHAILSIASELRERLPSSAVDFHLISSAGGLFEGITQVNENTLPDPRRPYGQLKLEQENLLLKTDFLNSIIYRPSTIYGPISTGNRRGLVSTLIHNGALHLVSDIRGHLYTLRDYVFFIDVANFISNIILNSTGDVKSRLYYLVSGKPTSILELKAIVERILRHPIYYKLQHQPDNSCDVSFSSFLIPDLWNPTDLFFGCEHIFNLWREKGIERSY